MKAIVVSEGLLNEKEISEDLKSLQEIVGGYIEMPFICNEFSENDVVVIVNEDGKLIEDLRPEIVLIDKKTNKVLDALLGNCIFCGRKEDNLIGLSDAQIEIIKDIMKSCVVEVDDYHSYTVRGIYV